MNAPLPRPHGWRVVPLDGALGAFHPATGARVRWDGPETAHLRAMAPRLVLFGPSHACNLACGFCSRDAARPSLWTVDEAFTLLSDLCDAGVLEVSLGGGEPLVWSGFDALVTRLAAHTALAVHVTTNGRLLTAARLAGWDGAIRQVRLSVYDGEPWRERAALLARCGQRFGANLLVTPATLNVLPALLQELADLGASDVALLRTLGADPALHLDAADEAALEAVVCRAPLPIQLSRCWADRLPQLPRLWPGDCGAGSDVIALGPDKRLAACSFGAVGPRVATAADVLAQWSTGRDWLSAPAGRAGCARPGLTAPALSPGVRVWQAWSGNFSGDCVLVGRFASVELAEGVAGAVQDPRSDRTVTTAGGALLALDYAADDVLGDVRGAVLAAGGRVVVDAVDVHRNAELLFARELREAEATEDVLLELGVSHEMARHGEDVLVVAATRCLSELIGALGPLAGELFVSSGQVRLPAMLAARPGEAQRVAVKFPDAAAAERFASERRWAWCGTLTISPNTRDPDRLSRHGARAGGAPVCLQGDRVVLSVVGPFDARREVPPILRDRAVLRQMLGEAEFVLDGTRLTVTTATPTIALDGLRALLATVPGQAWLTAAPADPLAVAICRVRAELARRRRLG